MMFIVNVALEKCGQMPRLLSHYSALSNNENLPNIIKDIPW